MENTSKLEIGDKVYKDIYELNNKELKFTQYHYGKIFSESTFKLDEISLRKDIIYNNNKRYFYFFPMAFIIWIVSDILSSYYINILSYVGYVIIAFLFWRVYKANTNFVVFETKRKRRLEFAYTNSTKDEVFIFTDKIIENIKVLLISKYGTIDSDIPFDNQIINLSWLKNNDIITDEVFENMKKTLKASFKK